MSKRSETIRVRVSPEEKAELEQRAGSQGVSAFVRSVVLAGPDSGTVGVACTPEADEQGQAAPAVSYRARVRQLSMQGLPHAAAVRVADQEFHGRRVS